MLFRSRTLGHDPVLGWIFGTANIITNALTRYDFQSFAVLNKQIYGVYPGSTFGMLENAGNFVQQDPLLLPTAVARQAIHFGSDYFTKQGLPVPLVATVNNDLAKNMVVKGSIDLWSVSRGAVLAWLINQLVAAVHQLFYRENRDGSQKLYEVRTRKILSYSNLMASGSNVIVSAVLSAGLDLNSALPEEETVEKVCTIFRELRCGETCDRSQKVKGTSGVLSTAEAISLLCNSMALAGSFGNGQISQADLAAALQGAIIKIGRAHV